MSVDALLESIVTPSMPKDSHAMANGLRRLKDLLQQLDIVPTQATVITVAGTNGKGSSVAFMETYLSRVGLRVGSYTSPHLYHFRERIKINGYPIEDRKIISTIEALQSKVDLSELTYFEVATLIALAVFATESLDVIVLEVGLGGRFDAVNAVDADIALITQIALDHQQWLGNTREAIGREKAGIMREQRPVVCGDPDPPESLTQHAEALGAIWHGMGQDFQYPSTWPTPLIGETNAAACLQVLKCLAVPFDEAQLQQILATLQVPGRLQHQMRVCDWLFDVAHNPASAHRLADHIAQLPPAKTTYAVVGMMADKDVKGTLSPLLPWIDQWHCVPLKDAQGRGAGVEKLSQSLKDICKKACYNHGSVTDAVEFLEAKQQVDDRIVVFGSFVTVAAVEGVLGGQQQ